MSTKVIVTNFSALSEKYGAAGLKDIKSALDRLIKADAARELQTKVISLDSTAAMKKVKGKVVGSATSERDTKIAIDAICKSLEPAYLVILGSADVVCHIKLNNPLNTDSDADNDDDDPDVPSDLPYTCDASFSRDIATFLGPTRVMGRIPDITGGTDASELVRLLDQSAKSKPGSKADYAKPFSITASVWKGSTAESVENIFGPGHATVNSPPPGHPGINPKLKARSWFINCHGAKADPKFYGEGPPRTFADAMESSKIAGKITSGTVIAAECCYGAELYDVQLAGTATPISNQALLSGAIGYVGATTIAYGPAAGNGAADLITQFFLIRVLGGASLGRSFLQAQHQFIQRESMSDPVNLKTIGQFLLLGDPSLQACESEAKQMKTVDEDIAVIRRRVALAGQGKALKAAATFPVRLRARLSALKEKPIARLVKRLGYRLENAEEFKVDGGPEARAAMKAKDFVERVVTVTKSHKVANAPQKLISVLVARTSGNSVISYKEYVSR
ncbi:MAG: hypothetical protein HC855_11655 [Rhizobiales bacterium]|nr:hypothetical protein [Hyphomicrobiales bacterium]